MSAKHTPGPWRFDDSGAIVRLFPIGDMSGCMAIAYGITGKHPDYMPQAEQHANARLIAAAPELLDALRATVAALEASGDGANLEMPSPALDNARALLARLEDAQ